MSKKVLIRAAGIQPLKKNEYRSGVPRSNVELLKALIAAFTAADCIRISVQ